MASHSSILAWRISWTEKPGELQSTGPQRVRHGWATNTLYITWLTNNNDSSGDKLHVTSTWPPRTLLPCSLCTTFCIYFLRGLFSSVSSVQSLSRVRLFVTPWTTARQASLSISNSWSPPKPMSIELVRPCSHLILCHPLLLPPSIFPGIRVFSNKSALCIRWPKYRSLSFSISPSSEHPGLIPFRMDGLDLLAAAF